MERKTAMSAIGYAICTVIILGIIMIVSAPMMVDKYNADKNSQTNRNFQPQVQEQMYNNANNSDNFYSLQETLNQVSSRLDSLERNQASQGSQGNQSVAQGTNRYICSMEGYLDNNGEVVPIDNPNRTEKIVFVCDYR